MLQIDYTRISWDDLRRQLGKVQKPARYVGGETNIIIKDLHEADVHFALAFPDAYEVGASHLGSQILYHVLNSDEKIACERVYSPWYDMEEILRAKSWPLYTLETRTPLYAFDIVGFSLQYELTYTNVLAMLDLGRIPLRSRDRDENHPLVIAGGPTAMSPEPLAEFIDAFVLGDGEEVVLEIVGAYREWRLSGSPKRDLFRRMAAIEGVYVPSLYQVDYNPDRTVARVSPIEGSGAPATVKRRVLGSLEESPYPQRPLIPLLPPIHDRAVVEIFRGCTQGCRFCQAGMLYRPVRERDLDDAERMAQEALALSGFDEVSLVSLSSADYSYIKELVSDLLANPCGAKVSLPSLRVDSFSVDLAQALEGSTKSGLTLAPEAGSQRMRDIINKRVSRDDILGAASRAFSAGYSRMKLYFMIGLPGERDEDVLAIGELATSIRKIGRDLGRRPTIVVSVSGFVPKAHTPFQWEECVEPQELARRQRLLKGALRGPGLEYRYHDAALTALEAVFARGDRRLAGALELAFRKGLRFDAWSEGPKGDVWEEALRESGIDVRFYAHRERSENEVLPWDHLESGVSKSFLLDERHNAHSGALTLDCRTEGCTDCGVCPYLGVDIRLAKAMGRDS